MKGDVTRERILFEGSKIVHLKGYHATGLQEILKAAQVPKGSFYFYFASKKDFGLELIDYYTNSIISKGTAFLEQENLTPLQSLKEHISWILHRSIKLGHKGGCPIGNLSQELGDTDEEFRNKLNQAYERLIEMHARFLKQAQNAGEIGMSLDANEIAGLVFNCYQGALIQMKVSRNVEAVHKIEQTLFRLIS